MSVIDKFMQAAIDEAKLGLAEGGIPIGSVIVKDGEIIGRGHNKRVQDNDPIIHAEIDCLRNAGRIGSYKDTILYSTLMPCYLCGGAIVQFGIKKSLLVNPKPFQVHLTLWKNMELKLLIWISTNVKI